MGLSRRQWLACLGAALAMPPFLNPALARRSMLPAAQIERLALALGPLPSVAAIGRLYLRETDGAFDAQAAALRLDRRLAEVGTDALGASLPRLERALAVLIESDLACRRQVSVAGWVLARSEADVCALYVRCQATSPGPDQIG